MNYFKGKDVLLLQEYFDLKIELSELKIKPGSFLYCLILSLRLIISFFLVFDFSDIVLPPVIC